MKSRIACLAILYLALAAAPAWEQSLTYDNGPINGTTDAWTINFGYVVSDTFAVDNNNVGGFSFGVWEFPGDTVTSVQWSITSGPVAGGPWPNALRWPTIYGAGVANVTDRFISTNQFGYDIDLISATIPSVNGLRNGGTYWLNLQNAVVPSGDPVFWDENSGARCKSNGCPSQAYESAVGTIPSEAFSVTCSGCGCFTDRSGCTLGPGGGAPEPSSFMLFGSGILGLAGVLRRRLF